MLVGCGDPVVEGLLQTSIRYLATALGSSEPLLVNCGLDAAANQSLAMSLGAHDLVKDAINGRTATSIAELDSYTKTLIRAMTDGSPNRGQIYSDS